MKIAAPLALPLADACARLLAGAPAAALVRLTPAPAARVAPGAEARSGSRRFDALGRRVAVELHGAARAGTTALVVDAPAPPAGSHLLVVSETFTTTARVSVAR